MVGSGQRVALVAHGLSTGFSAILLGQPPAAILGMRQDNDTIVRIVQQDGFAAANHFVGDDELIPGIPMVRARPPISLSSPLAAVNLLPCFSSTEGRATPRRAG